MLDGFASGPRSVPLCTLDMEALTARSYNPFDRQQTNEVKIAQLIAAASRLFNQRGINGASLDDIGAEVGATKGAVYHYFDDKADLVTRCYRRAFELFDLIMDTAVTQGRDGFDKALIVLHLNVQAQAGPASPLMLQPGRLALAEADRAAFERAAQRLRITSNRNLRQGTADGSVRPCDTAFVSPVAAGIFLWLPKWLPRNGALSPRQIAEAVCDLIAYGLRPRPA
ncbi:MAG: TetR/AcrR family transcriptional regulator [Phenylobacterium sp.]|uniref:TetR/AcrR family transcriptional regulator n=1 Tax=Phenylobacterium sp. TaxID=1871053 RepID=UPI003919F000